MQEFPENNTADPEISKKVYLIILSVSLVWLMLIFVCPLFMKFGGEYEKISSFVYLFFSKVCHQQDERSFHLFEHKLGVCSRCVWIYAGFLIGTVLYPFRKDLSNVNTPSSWFLIIAVSILFIDVLLDSLGIISNTIYSRSVTGFIIGTVLPFYLIPGFVRFFHELFTFLKNKVST